MAGLVVACAGQDPEACPLALASARGVYVECVQAIGLEIVELEIGANGDIDVRFGASSEPEDVEAARYTCEPLMQVALVRGQLACHATEVGSPAGADALAAELERGGEDGFSGSVAIVRDDVLLYSGAAGLANRSEGIANTPRTAFDCGSIMKMVTAAAIYQLEAEGRLARGMSLGELFTDVPADKAAITLDQVLVHTAGFQEFHDTEGDFEPVDRATALARIFAQPLLFAPGQGEAYSSSGYTLLAAVVEDVSGLPFGEYIHTRLFEPASMDDTGVFGEPLWSAPESAIGYEDGSFGCNSPACWPAPSWALVGNGGLVSTVQDLVAWTAAIDDGRIFDAPTRDAFRDDLLAPAGFTVDGMSAYVYTGRNDFGFGATIVEVPSRGTWVAVATNTAPSYDDTVLAVQLAQMSMGALLEVPEE